MKKYTVLGLLLAFIFDIGAAPTSLSFSQAAAVDQASPPVAAKQTTLEKIKAGFKKAGTSIKEGFKKAGAKIKTGFQKVGAKIKTGVQTIKNKIIPVSRVTINGKTHAIMKDQVYYVDDNEDETEAEQQNNGASPAQDEQEVSLTDSQVTTPVGSKQVTSLQVQRDLVSPTQGMVQTVNQPMASQTQQAMVENGVAQKAAYQAASAQNKAPNRVVTKTAIERPVNAGLDDFSLLEKTMRDFSAVPLKISLYESIAPEVNKKRIALRTQLRKLFAQATFKEQLLPMLEALTSIERNQANVVAMISAEVMKALNEATGKNELSKTIKAFSMLSDQERTALGTTLKDITKKLDAIDALIKKAETAIAAPFSLIKNWMTWGQRPRDFYAKAKEGVKELLTNLKQGRQTLGKNVELFGRALKQAMLNERVNIANAVTAAIKN